MVKSETADDIKVQGLRPESVKNVFVDFTNVMINAPMTCLTLNRLQSLMMVGHETSIQTKKRKCQDSAKFAAILAVTTIIILDV